MSKDTFYFSHDCNARSDRKMIALRKEMKMKGLGIYWCVVEMLYEESGYISIGEIENIAFDLRVKKSEVEQVLKSFDLFVFDNEKFWSDSVLKRLQKRNSKTKKAAESANTRWNRANENANALRTECDGNANKEKKSIVKENKEKNIHQEEDACPAEIDLSFPKQILSDFGFSEIANFDKLRLVTAFLKKIKDSGRADYFSEQYMNYQQYKILSGEKKHNFTSFFGEQSEQFDNGKWDEANWGKKINEHKEKLKQKNGTESKRVVAVGGFGKL